MTTSNTTDISQKVSVSSVPIPHSAFEIAWCGWSLPVPESWQPLKIQGTWDKGQMMIGCGSDPVVLIKWWRPREKTRDAEAWLARRFKALHALPDDEAPHPDDFDAVGWIRHLENKDGSAKTVWYGHAARAGLVLECITTSDVKPALQAYVIETGLSQLRAAPADGPLPWSVFSTRFLAPPGYSLAAHRLALGDISLDLRADGGRRLVLRQVFPAGLALQRRPLESWMAASPFTDRRRLSKPESGPAMAGGGLRQCGWQRLPSPLGWLNPRYCDRVAMVDADRDRLSLVAMQARREFDRDRMARIMENLQS
jgi:hypothetical protein